MDGRAPGLGMVRNITDFVNLVLTLIYIKSSDSCNNTWTDVHKVDWRGKIINWEEIKLFIKVAFPIGAILYLDLATGEFFTIIAGQFNNVQLAVHVALSNTAALYYMLPLGISLTIMTFISNFMGAKLPNRARNELWIGTITSVVIIFIFLSILLIFKKQWANIFSSDVETHNLILEMLPLVALILAIDGIQVTVSGVLKGIGKQGLAAKAVLVAFYVIGLPVIFLLAFTYDLQIYGIWLGVGMVSIILDIVYLWALKRMDFRVQAEEIAKNMEKNEIELEERLI